MEKDKNNRLDELFNQAKNEPSKVSFDEIKGQFIRSTVGTESVSTASKLFQINHLKIIAMISTLSIIVAGAFMFVNNTAEEPIEEVGSIKETSVKELVITETKHVEVVNTHLKKVKPIPANLKKSYPSEQKIALNINTVPKDSLKKALKSQVISKRNQEILDTAYRFPNLGYEDITANQRQKIKMFGKVKRLKNKRAIGFDQPHPNGFVIIPNGTYKRNDESISVQPFYMKQTEVTNLEYRTFLFDLLIQGRKSEFLIAKPDQKMWVKEYPKAFNKPMQDNYFSHPAYNEYPAVGMSREGAEMYCQWFKEELIKVSHGDQMNDVRIPTNYEWEWAASGGGENLYGWDKIQKRQNSLGCFLGNFKYEPKDDTIPFIGCDIKTTTAFTTSGLVLGTEQFVVKINSYNPNKFGLYCMSGNVAEMVYYNNYALPGTRGGSWSSIGQELQIVEGKDRFKGQTTPSVNIGFRPVLSFMGRSKKVKYAEDITIIPPGTKKIDHNFFIDKTEVSNAAWREYLNWIKNTKGVSSLEYLNAFPDSLVWRTKSGFNEPYIKFYLNHPAYDLYPVVGVSYEQAVAFCKWRTDRVKEYFEILKQKNKKSIYPKSFEYRLPTKEEWERVSKVGNSLKTIKKLEGAKYSEMNTSNLKRGKGDNIGEAGNLNDNADITAPVLSYWPNKFGLYNLIGNVAEMTSEKGLAKGGAWIHQDKEVSVGKDFVYTGPTNWLGFRCVFVVKDPELMQNK